MENIVLNICRKYSLNDHHFSRKSVTFLKSYYYLSERFFGFNCNRRQTIYGFPTNTIDNGAVAKLFAFSNNFKK